MHNLSNEYVISAMCADIKPVLTVNAGDIVKVNTLDCFSNLLENENQTMGQLSADKMNPCTGPIYINGAVKGDILKVEILDITVGNHGVMLTDAGGVNKYCMSEPEKSIHIKVDNNQIYLTDDVIIPIKPMIGCIGTAPEDGAVLTTIPGTHGGNMDNAKITAGSTLLLPVYHDGALLSLGDLHAAMGDGEVTGCGVEIFGDVTIRVSVIKNLKLQLPAVITDDVFMTIASAKTLDEAAETSVKMMLDNLVSSSDLSERDAWKIVGIIANIRICQIVNALKSVRCEVPLSVCGNLLKKLCDI